jgi:hypothetical protein
MPGNPIVVGSRIYVFGKDGATTVRQAGNEYNERTEANRLWAASEPTEEKERATFDQVTHCMP